MVDTALVSFVLDGLKFAVFSGAYSQSTGIEVVRKHVAEYIERRDGIPSDPENVILSGGASESIRVSFVFEMI